MTVFNPKQHHVPIGELFSLRKNRYEEDHHLYFDSSTGDFFIVESTEHESGPNVTPNHTIQMLDYQRLESVLQQHPELREKSEQVAAQHRGRA